MNVPRNNDFDPHSLKSLHALALDAARSDAARAYLEYYDVVNYAEKMLVYPLLDGTSMWADETQEREALVLSSSFQIVFLEALHRLDEIVANCDDSDSEDGVDHHEIVDEVAALLIGSQEGSSLGGSADSDDGYLAWNLGSRHAFQFQTLSTYNYGNVNKDLIDELYATKAEMTSGVCSRVSKSVSNIQGLMQTSMLQAIVAAALEIENDRSEEGSLSMVHAHVLGTALLPLVHHHDAETAQFLKENIVNKPGVEMIQQGSSAISEAITYYVQDTLLLSPCHYLGRASSLNCDQYEPPTAMTTRASGAVNSRSDLLAAALGTAFALVFLV